VAAGEAVGFGFGDGVAADGLGETAALALAVGVGSGVGDADTFGDGAPELRVFGEECGSGVTRSNGVGVATTAAVCGLGAAFGELAEPPKKCANRPPSNSPAKMTITTSGNSGRPPLPPESSSERRRRGAPLT
jgi:hypothetical protein